MPHASGNDTRHFRRLTADRLLATKAVFSLSVVSFQFKKNGKRRENGGLALRTED